jgi:hypothetical protein
MGLTLTYSEAEYNSLMALTERLDARATYLEDRILATLGPESDDGKEILARRADAKTRYDARIADAGKYLKV